MEINLQELRTKKSEQNQIFVFCPFSLKSLNNYTIKLFL